MPKKKSAKDAPAQFTGISDLIKKLFQAAITLRGSVEPSDYKRAS